jgi:hypothetical protein
MNKIFGIGLSKTGTTSLAMGLKKLGYRTVHWASDSLTFRELVAGKYRLSILENHEAILDTPIPALYPQFDAVYPGSKFILTVRQVDSWIDSMRRHRELQESREQARDDRVVSMTFRHFSRLVTYGVIDFNEERYRYVYNSHLREVERYFRERPEDLLVLDVCAGQGWEKLCSFLGKPLPTGAFPASNGARERDEWEQRTRQALLELKQMVDKPTALVLADQVAFAYAAGDWTGSIPFTERDGKYWGLPANGAEAIEEIECRRQMGAQYVAFSFSAHWMLDHYEGLRKHLVGQYMCLRENRNLIVFDLRQPAERSANPPAHD